MRARIVFFSIICLAFASALHASPTEEFDLGQWDLRKEFADRAGDENFRKSHDLVDIAEIYWNAVLTGKELPSDLMDIHASWHQVRKSVAESPWNVIKILQDTRTLFQNYGRYPHDFWTESEHLWSLVAVPLSFSLLLVFFFYLWIWAPAIAISLPPWIKGNRKAVIRFSLLALYVWMIAFQQWAWGLSLILFLAVIYQRKPVPLFIVSLVVGLGLLFYSLLPVWTRSHESLVGPEALSQGRTRIEYSDYSLSRLDPVEKAVWSYWNGRTSEARQWLNRAPKDLRAAMFDLQLRYRERTPSQLEEAYRLMESRDGDAAENHVFQYNFRQIYLRTQNLVRAEQKQGVINDQLEILSSRQEATSDDLLAPTHIMRLGFFDVVSEEANQWLRDQSFLPWSWIYSPLLILLLFLPLAFPFLALFLRRRAAGLCAHSGQPTSSVDNDASPVYIAVNSQGNSKIEQRQHLDQLIRTENRLRRRRLAWWGWILPASVPLIYDSRWGRSLLSTFLFSTLIWLGLARSAREAVLAWLGTPAELGISAMTFAPWILGTGILLWVVVIWRSRREHLR